MERAHRVDVTPHSSLALPLVFTDDTAITLSWNPQHIFPQVNPDLEPFNVDVLLYTFNVDSAQWVEHSILADNIDNDGSMLVTIPFGISDDVVAMAIQVATSLNANAAITSDGLYMKLFRAGQRVGIWSAEYYYVNPNIARMTGRGLCQNWNTQEPIPDSLVAGSTPCAPTVQQAQLASSGLSEIVLDSVYGSSLYSRQWADTFHPGTSHCFKRDTKKKAEWLAAEKKLCDGDTKKKAAWSSGDSEKLASKQLEQDVISHPSVTSTILSTPTTGGGNPTPVTMAPDDGTGDNPVTVAVPDDGSGTGDNLVTVATPDEGTGDNLVTMATPDDGAGDSPTPACITALDTGDGDGGSKEDEVSVAGTISQSEGVTKDSGVCSLPTPPGYPPMHRSQCLRSKCYEGAHFRMGYSLDVLC